MKKQKIFYWTMLLLLPASVLVAGCSKFLDRKPLTATLEDLNQGQLEGQVLGLYSNLRTLPGFSTLPWVDFHSIRDDDAQKGSDINDGAEIVAEFDNFQYSKDDWAPNTYWNDHYTMINLANEAVYTADSLDVQDAASVRNLGEACFFRAYAYFELVKTYGDVPLFKQPIRNPNDGIRDKSPAAQVYAFIDSNLQVAAQLLPVTSAAYGEGYTGRLTRGAANTLWAQTQLFRGNWAQVVALTTDVINSGQYSLEAEFSDIWRDRGENGKESIWEMQAYSGPGAATNSAVNYGSDWGTMQQVRRNGAPVEWNLGWGWNTPTDKLERDWPADDPRKRKTILYSGQNDGGAEFGGYGATLPPYTNPSGNGGLAQRYWNKKVYTGNDPAIRQATGFINNNGASPWINHRILRYADVILMLAEAANELGQGDVAAANLELIRNRASGNRGQTRTVVPYIPFQNQAQMRAAIKAERRWEFAMEGYRFYDLVRWGDAQQELGPLGYTNRARFYPIPQKAIDLTGGVLTQNPEW
ncbi:RagB/SusD family nutrient uptake outer membrane protein [Paracnuella aquatica]|uniref:RagB/SusD family nutrient uptake outer membrane protein n=1 Tax=Paracnuella aquatica TaxID=2268757 RepID=UPI000DF00867|nr:RagB/SusD family nutrient uptake outer membrane protein [Paracnuella aquatica]RPD44396.1 RagB/SusD family nutrient uptake outer membrane protein [Paracnuella aquatica]